MKKSCRRAVLGLIYAAFALKADALTLYGIDAYTNSIFAIDPATGSTLSTCTTTSPGFITGMGVVIVGSNAYYTDDSGTVRKVDLATCVTSPAFTIAGSSFGKMAYDGTNLW